ncbi:MAG: hypothetical protein JXA33_26835 [Anaerolineae bacterium]|nr:hypothetical protein [Anaerolineae bacterium]
MNVVGVRSLGEQSSVTETEHQNPWTESNIRQTILHLRRAALGAASATLDDNRAVEAIVQLARQTKIYQALRQRRDPPEVALRDVATRYAFDRLLNQHQAVYELDALSRAMVHHTITLIYRYADEIQRCTGEDPLDADPKLWTYLCKTVACYVPRIPLGAFILGKLRRYESAVSRAMRQIKTLVTHPKIAAAFCEYVLDVHISAILKAQLLQIARGGGVSGVNYPEIIRFFADPETVTFVKRYANTVQTAYTLYARNEYYDVVWQGRKLRADVHWGYLEAALAQIQPAEMESLDDDEAFDLHTIVGETQDNDLDYLHREPFEVWVVRCALEHRPDDPLWQAARWHYLEHLSPAAIITRGLSTQEMLAAAQARIEALRADTEIWHLWMQSTL